MQNFNFNQHTFRCNHADIIEDEEYIKEYIKEGYKRIAFTDHCPEKNIIDTYLYLFKCYIYLYVRR